MSEDGLGTERNK
jgi:hypothetical protein